MKPTENYEQLLERFNKRTEQLVDRLMNCKMLIMNMSALKEI